MKGVDALPVEHRHDAEARLIPVRGRARPGRAARLAHHVLGVVTPQIAEDHQLKALQRQEALGRGSLPQVTDRRRRARAVPRPVHVPPHPGRGDAQAGGARDELTQAPPPLRHPQGARARVLRVRPPLPPRPVAGAGGVDTTIVVTMTLENLLGDSRRQLLLDTADPITADQARKLACEAGIIPMVLGAKSRILDLGRQQTALRPGPADRDPRPRPTLHRRRMRLARSDVPRPPQRALVPGRQARPRRRTPALPPTPLLRPLPKYEMKTSHERTRRLRPDVAASQRSCTRLPEVSELGRRVGHVNRL